MRSPIHTLRGRCARAIDVSIGERASGERALKTAIPRFVFGVRGLDAGLICPAVRGVRHPDASRRRTRADAARCFRGKPTAPLWSLEPAVVFWPPALEPNIMSSRACPTIQRLRQSMGSQIHALVMKCVLHPLVKHCGLRLRLCLRHADSPRGHRPAPDSAPTRRRFPASLSHQNRGPIEKS